MNWLEELLGWNARIVSPDIAAGYRAACASSDPVQQRLVWREPPEAVVARFEDMYMRLVRERWPNLEPRRARFAEYAAFVRELGVGLEDYTADQLADPSLMRLHLDRLNSQLTYAAATPTEDGPARRLWTADLVVDVLLGACLVPAATVLGPDKHDTDLHFDYTAEVSRHWVQGLPMDLAEELIKELRLGCSSSRGLQHSILLSGLDVEGYATMSVPQRLCHLGLANLSPAFRRTVLASPLVEQVLAAPDLPLWMLSCSNSDEQYWLNTCEVAARNGMLAARLPTVAHCVVLTRDIVAHLRSTRLPRLAKDRPWTRTLWGRCCGRVPSVRAHCERVLAAADEELDALESRIRAALAAGPSLARQAELQRLVQDWNRATQRLSSVYAPEEPVVLSRKLFSDAWRRSAQAAALPCTLGSLWPGQPLVLSRNEGTLGEYDSSGSRFTWRDRLAPQSFPQFAELPRKMAGPEARALLEELWRLALAYGGLFFASQETIFGVRVGHLNGLYALRLADGTAHFLVGDPEIRRFKLPSVEEMRALVMSDKVSFDLFDV